MDHRNENVPKDHSWWPGAVIPCIIGFSYFQVMKYVIIVISPLIALEVI